MIPFRDIEAINNIIMRANNLYDLLSLLVRENVIFNNAITIIRYYVIENEGLIVEQEDGGFVVYCNDVIAVCFKTGAGLLGYDKLTGSSCVN